MVKVRGEPTRNTTQVTQNQVSLYMSHDEDPPSSPPPRERISHRSKRKQSETCCEIDETMDRLRRNAAGDGRQLATLDCVEAPALKPVRSRKGGSKRDKLEMGDKEISLPNLPQVTMTFEELNGLIKRKGTGGYWIVSGDGGIGLEPPLPSSMQFSNYLPTHSNL